MEIRGKPSVSLFSDNRKRIDERRRLRGEREAGVRSGSTRVLGDRSGNDDPVDFNQMVGESQSLAAIDSQVPHAAPPFNFQAHDGIEGTAGDQASQVEAVGKGDVVLYGQIPEAKRSYSSFQIDLDTVFGNLHRPCHVMLVAAFKAVKLRRIG